MKKKNLLQRAIIIAIVTLLGTYIVIGPRRKPRLNDFTWSGIKANLASNIRLGLDLRGGSHLVMRVRTDQFLKKLTEGNALAVQTAAKDAGYPPKDVKVEATSGNYRIILEAADPSKLGDIEEAVKKKVDLTEWTSSTSANAISWTLTPTAQRALAEQATEQAQRIIESRLDAVGVAEPLVQRHGAQSAHQILVQMPGIQDQSASRSCSRRVTARTGSRCQSPVRHHANYATRGSRSFFRGSSEQRKVLYPERTEPKPPTTPRR